MVTIGKKPLSVVPAHNDIEFYATSDEYSHSDFKFYITLSIPAFGDTFIFRKDANSSGEVYFNCSNIVREYVKAYYPFGVYSWRLIQDSITDVTVNIGEFYSGTVHTGSNITFKVWDAALTKDERRIYLPDNYQVKNGRTNIWLNNFDYTKTVTVKSTQDFVLYFLQTGTYKVEYMDISDTSSGSIATPSVIQNPYQTYDMFCINAGPNGLLNLVAGDVSAGPFPVITTATTSYRIRFRYSIGGTGTAIYATINVTVSDCAPRFDNVILFYQNRLGAFDFYNFYGNHIKNTSVEKTFFKGLNSYNEGSYNNTSINVLGPNPQSINKKPINFTYTNTQVLESDWLSDYDISILSDLITSPYVFVNKGVGDYKRYTEDDLAYPGKDKMQALRRLTVNLSEGTTEARQRG